MPSRFNIFAALAISFVVAPCRGEAVAESASNSTSNEGSPGRHHAEISVEFQGGLIGRNMASVIREFSKIGKLLPTKRYQVPPGTTFCEMLSSELSVPPHACTKELISSIRDLPGNKRRRLNPNHLAFGQEVVLPNFRHQSTSFKRYFDATSQLDNDRKKALKKSPAWRQIHKQQYTYSGDFQTPSIEENEYGSIRWQFFAIDRKTAELAELYALDLSNWNLNIDVEYEQGFEKKLHAYSARDHFKNWCESEGAENVEGSFSDHLLGFYDASNGMECVDSIETPSVAVIDTPVLLHSDLMHALSEKYREKNKGKEFEPASSKCERGEFERSAHHGTLLSTILASGENDYGFSGVYPNSNIVPFNWSDKQATNISLRKFIKNFYNPRKPQILLFASEFKSFPKPKVGETYTHRDIRKFKKFWKRHADGSWIDELRNDKVRFLDTLAKYVSQNPFLLIAAAGQEGEEGRSITAVTPMSPQNLGDRENVLIVAACDECGLEDARLWKPANFSQHSRAFVQLLAPGGFEVPSYLPSGKIGLTVGGTSAAAAFVAGVAAKVASCYPQNFSGSGKSLKERLIVTSRPIPDREQAHKIGAGIVDPSVSLLNPNKTWLKLIDKKPSAVTFSHWCSRSLELVSDEDNLEHVGLRKTKRIANVGESLFIGDQKFATGAGLAATSFIKRIGPGNLESGTLIAAVQKVQDGNMCVIRSNNLKDLILAVDVDSNKIASCRNISACE